MSIYQLINRLCIELIKECDETDTSLQSAKRIAFEILLKKSFDEKINCESTIENYNFLTFELSLLNKSKEIENVEEFISILKENSSDVSFIAASDLLISLKNIDQSKNEHTKHDFLQLQTSTLNDISKNQYISNSLFGKGKSINENSRRSSNKNESLNFLSSILEFHVGLAAADNQRDILKLKPIDTKQIEQNKKKLCSSSGSTSTKRNQTYKTWESLCWGEEDYDQRSFATESTNSFISQRLLSFSKHKAHTEIITLPFQKILNDIKLLMIGIESESFKRDDDTLIFHATTQISCDDISYLDGLLDNFLETGTCFKRLKVYTAKNPFNQNQIFNGIIFKAFCDRVIKFLNYCRDIIYTQEVETLLELHHNTLNLQRIVIHLSKFLNIHPSVKTRQNCIPNGSDVLRQLYNEYTNALNNDIKCFFVELLKACCEVYYLRYKEWFYHGVLDDPHEELFIYFVDHYNLNTKYYFDRAYLIRKQSVPPFLSGCAEDVLLCGKYTMLLKSYNPMHPLLMLTKPSFKICLTFEEVNQLKKSCEEFLKKARIECGECISIAEIMEKKEREDYEKYKNAEIASVKNMNKWKQQQEERIEEIRIHREHQQKELCKELEIIEERRILKRMEEIQAERDYLEEIEEIESAELERENAVLRERIKLYQQLNEKLDKANEKSEVALDEIELKFNTREEDILNANNQINHQSPSKVMKDELNNVIEKEVVTLTDAQKNKFKVLSHEFNYTTDNHQQSDVENKNTMNNNHHTLTDAQKNRLKVMGHEYNMLEKDEENAKPKISIQDYDKMTDLQRNRLKVMSHEFEQIDDKLIPPQKEKSHTTTTTTMMMTDLQRNRQKVLSHEFAYDEILPINEKNRETFIESKKLSLDLLKPEMDKQALESPMSVTSDNFNSDCNDFLEKSFQSSNDDDENAEMLKAFEEAIERNRLNFITLNDSNEHSSIMSNYESMMKIDSMALSKFLQTSLMLPLSSYMEVLNNETLKLFVKDLEILSHFKSLRNYFLLMNGEYCSSICHDIFSKIQSGLKPAELLNFQSLHMILDNALSNSRYDPFTENLSFIVQNIPDKFELYSPSILSMLSLSYKIEWPLSLILNPETMDQYRAIFNYLIKLKRISWILEECFQILKESHREHGCELLKSQQYRNVQHIRHKMMHFVSCLENYITRNVLQISWNAFMQDLKTAGTILCIYRKHTNYLKRILFLCLLTKRSIEFYKSIEDIFKVILKFHKHLKSSCWSKSSTNYVHEKYEKIVFDANDFDRLLRYVMYLGNKIIQHGNQMEIYDLLQLIDINGYYSNSIN